MSTTPPNQYATAKAVGEYLDAKTAENLSPRTSEDYRYRLGVFARECPVLPLEPAPIRAYLARREGTPENRETHYRRIRALYNWLVQQDTIDQVDNPMRKIKAPKIPFKLVDALSAEELATILHAPMYRRVKAFIWLISDTGARLGEALSVDDPRKFTRHEYKGHPHYTVKVRGKDGEREIPVSARVYRMVLSVLPWPWANARTACRAVSREFKRLNLLPKGSKRAHALRHTYGRLWEGDLGDLQDIFGHASPATTRRYYAPFQVARLIPKVRRHSPLRTLMRSPEHRAAVPSLG
jgi:integrase